MSRDQSKIMSWIRLSTDIQDFAVEIEGTTEKGQGYVGDFIFVRVKRIGDQKDLHLAIKASKDDPLTREKFPFFRDICRREVFFYDKVIPAFNNFQKEKNVKDSFTATPECYKSFILDDAEIIVMKNLRKEGYELHPKESALNKQHVLLTLKNYAKFHALSFALQDQKKDLYIELTKNYHNVVKEAMFSFKPLYDTKCLNVLKNLKEIGRQDLAAQYEKYIEKGIYKQFEDILNSTPNESVIIHADCHNSNFMFKYKDSSKDSPSDMVLIDFQTSMLHSPMLDISDFLYLCLSKEGFSQLNNLLDFYYEEFSSFLRRLGSDSNKLFPKSTMLDHWTLYSGYGFTISSTYMDMMFVNKENAPSITVNENGRICDEMMNVKITSKERYMERLLPVMEHFFNSTIKK